MKLFLLREADDIPYGHSPWDNNWTVINKMIIRAENEEDARKIADLNGYQENDGCNGGHSKHPWLDPSLSSCEELTDDGKPGLIIFESTSP